MDSIRCFIFDLDGTLVFNEQANLLAYQAAFRAVGLELSERDFVPHFKAGGSIEDIFADYSKKHALKNSADILRKIKKQKVIEYGKRLHLIDRNDTIIGLLHALSPHYFTALATTARAENARAVLDYFNLTKLFKYMVFGEDVAHKKPDPECHWKIAEYFGVRSEECLVFEDSPKGFAAAEAFGSHICKVVQ